MNEPADLQPRPVSLALPLAKPIATYVLAGIIGAVFLLETAAGGSTQTEVLVRLGAKVTPLIAAGEFWRLLTSMFLHIGAMHLFFNGYALLVLGTELERLLGWGRFLAIYLLSGLFGGLASYAFSDKVSAGASGAIFGLIGALAAFFALHRRQLGSWGQRRLANILFLIAINLFLGFTQPWIDNWAHIGGLLGGLGLGLALTPLYKVDPIQRRVVDHNHLGRYWPSLVLAVVLLVGGTALVTVFKRDGYQSHLYRAEQAIQREAWGEAIVELEEALALKPDATDVVVYFYLGLARNHLDQPEQAAQAYESALALEPDDPSSHWNLALTYLQLGRLEAARSHFESYLALRPDAADEVRPYLEELNSPLSSPPL